MSLQIDYLTWDGKSADSILPRRPSTDDLGGDQKLDDDEYPPDLVEHVHAAGWNQIVKQVVALAKISGVCKLDIDFSSGTPFVSKVAAPSANIVPATFTITDLGVGVTRIEWVSGTFPTKNCRPTGLTLHNTSVNVSAAHMQEVAGGVLIRTFQSGSPADIPFSFEIN